jgi:hypothetical protein
VDALLNGYIDEFIKEFLLYKKTGSTSTAKVGNKE